MWPKYPYNRSRQHSQCPAPSRALGRNKKDGSCPRPKRQRRRVGFYQSIVLVAPLVVVVVQSVPVLPTTTTQQENTTSSRQQEDDFMAWCTQVLGIHTTLEIKEFEYYDYLQARMNQMDDSEDEMCDNDDDDEITTTTPTVHDYPTISVRGLAATRDIEPGDVVISIPFHAMISVPTTIDHDPVLSGILGPSQRLERGWDNVYFESPLLTIAILYHKHLGRKSPLYQYIQVLETNSPRDTMPLLWDKPRLKAHTTVGVRKIVRGIQTDVEEMYKTVLVVLREEHPNVFGEFTLADFSWAFAMVNSRHWHVPISDLNTAIKSSKTAVTEESEYGYAAGGQVVLPASQPTEEWVREQEEAEETADHDDDMNNANKDSHSFMAPVADLLNFGPPCTQGRYNTQKKAFELIATCSFRPGQEVTFWYSNDCEDVMIANYGFTHPMVPTCLSEREKSDLWRRRAELLETKLQEAYKELGEMDVELESALSVLQECDCDVEPRPAQSNNEPPTHVEPTKLRHWRQQETGVRGRAQHGSGHGSDEHARHGIRRKWHHTSKSAEDIGL